MYPNSRLPRLQVNDGYSTSTLFYTFLEKTGVVSRINDAHFLCETVIQEDNTTYITILKIVLPPSNSDEKNILSQYFALDNNFN